MVPFGQGLIPVLQDFTAAFAVRVLRLLEIPVFLDGVLIAIPSGLFEVAEACAGLRFLIANVVIALLFCYVSFRRPWKWIVFIIISIVIPIIANAFRATAIILIAYWTNNEYAAGVDHIVYGWVFFAVIMISLLAIGNAFADPVIEDTDEPSPSRQKPAGTLPLIYSAPLVLAVLLVTPSYAAIMLKAPTAVPHLALPAVDVGAPWEPVAASNWQPSKSGADLTIARAYEQDGRRVDLFIGYYAYQRPGAELVSEKEGLADGQLWRTAERQQEELGIPGLPAMVELERLKTVANDERVSLALYWTAGRFVTNRYEVLAWLALDRLLGRNRPAAFIALSAPFTTTMGEGVTNLKKFLAENRDLPDYLNSIEITRPLGKS
jgi:EpsI family protein